VNEVIDMKRHKTEHSGRRNSDLTADDGQQNRHHRHTGKTAKGLDWSSFKQSDRNAWEALQKK